MMKDMYHLILGGQIMLVICCVFYSVWWSISYRPGVSVNRAGGLNGLLLLITAVCGVSGLAASIYGINAEPEAGTLAEQTAKMNGLAIAIAGIAAYIVLLIITKLIFHRVVTTELLLIVGWTVLELYVINALKASSKLSDPRFYVMLAVIAAAFIISMILYVLYYRMEEMKAFYAAMVPLITEAVSMTVLVLLMVIKQ